MTNVFGTKLICLIGIDGSGKTTLARALRDELDNRGYRADSIYGGYTAKLGLPFLKFSDSYIFSSDPFSDYNSHAEQKEEFFSRDWTSHLWEKIVICDYYPQLLVKLLPRMVVNDYVICDRYIHDVLLNEFAPNILDSHEKALGKYHRYSTLVPNPYRTFHVSIPIGVALERKSDIPSATYLNERKILYDSLAAEINIPCIDGTKPISSLVSEMLQVIER